MQNANLLSSRVRNYSRLVQRHVVLNVSVDHQTRRHCWGRFRTRSASIESHQPVRFERSHFANIAPASFDFEAVYFVLANDYVKHMDILQDINLRLVQWFEESGIALGAPQRLYLSDQQPRGLVESSTSASGGQAARPRRTTV